MPINPVMNSITLPVETSSDVSALMETLRGVAKLSSQPKRSDMSRDLADHFAYLAGTQAELFRPHQVEVARLPDDQLAEFGPSFSDLAVLMFGASDEVAEQFAARLCKQPGDFYLPSLLASIGTEYALTAVADHARKQKCIGAYEELGVEIPASGPAVWRFSRNRLAVFKHERPVATDAAHSVGLPIADIIVTPDDLITWHYATLQTSGIALGINLPERLHLVSPRQHCEWTMFFEVDEHSRYCFPTSVLSEDEGDVYAEMLGNIERADGDKGEIELRPYDSNLVYCNGHILLTESVVGTVGGPPIGIYANPKCPNCERLMFHVMSVEHNVREYGDGVRSLYFCEDCSRAACTATAWN